MQLRPTREEPGSPFWILPVFALARALGWFGYVNLSWQPVTIIPERPTDSNPTQFPTQPDISAIITMLNETVWTPKFLG
ncbi:MAG: hypothetical protein M2R45_01306 [Verrucomicrobia subdivision 3 bacterium]|nr:hypothetical protein [Limisphaerales bacterium]MCS1415172.1 hypothetical protein [Limisphaerales bacterium]